MTTTKRKLPEGIYERPDSPDSLWITYSINGARVRESARTTKVREAVKLRQLRLAKYAATGAVSATVEKIMVPELWPGIVDDYRNTGRKSFDDLEARWRLHLLPFFQCFRVSQVTTDAFNAYIRARLEETATAATINRELSAFKRMLRIGMNASPPKVLRMPYIPHLRETDARMGFLEAKQHDALAAECAKNGLWLRAMFEVGYTFGWRHEEILAMRVRQVNPLAGIGGTIRLDPGTTKNDGGREVTMTKAVRELLVPLMFGKEADDCLFTRENGNQVRDFRGSWRAACIAAHVPDLLFHDLRRTAVRNMVRAGVPERVAMMISGHKTRSIFDRYHIVSQTDIAEAIGKVEVEQDRVNEAVRLSFGHETVTRESSSKLARVVTN